MKGKVKKITVGITIALILMIPTMNEYANKNRSEPKWGGEVIAWMLPGLTYGLLKTMKEGFEA